MRIISSGVFFCLVWLSAIFSAWGNDLTYTRKVLPSGFTLVLHEDFSHPVVSVHLVVRTGSIYEDPRVNGIAHFYEHMFFKGTSRRNAFQMKNEIERLGGEMNGATYKDFTEFHIVVPSPYARQAVDLLMDAFLNATLDSQELERERKVVIEEISLNRQSPPRMLMDLFYEQLYPSHPYRIPVGGTPTSVGRISREDLQQFKERYYVPGNAALVVVGGVSAREVEAQVATLLARAPSPPLNLPPVGKETPRVKPKRQAHYEEVDRAYLVLGYLVSGLDTPDEIPPLDVLTFLLGQGEASRLDRVIKEEKELVTEISANYQTVRFPGSLEITAVLDPDKVDKARAAILAELAAVKRGEISDGELVRAKRLLEGTYLLGHETMKGKAGTLAHYEGNGAIRFVDDYLVRIRKVTVADLKRIAAKYIGDNETEVLLLPKKNEPSPPKSPPGPSREPPKR